MNCPYCRKAMLKGLINSGTLGMMVWEESKENGSAKILNFGKNKKKTVVLEQDSADTPLKYTEAYLCEACHKVIIDYLPED